MPDELNDVFNASRTPAPSADLRARILAEAKAGSATPASSPAVSSPAANLRASNDNSPRRWAALSAIAATLLVMAFAGFSLSGQFTDTDESEAWADYASAAGFDDLYAWVEGE